MLIAVEVQYLSFFLSWLRNAEGYRSNTRTTSGVHYCYMFVNLLIWVDQISSILTFKITWVETWREIQWQLVIPFSTPQNWKKVLHLSSGAKMNLSFNLSILTKLRIVSLLLFLGDNGCWRKINSRFCDLKLDFFFTFFNLNNTPIISI